MPNTQEAWLAQFLNAYRCTAIWLGPDFSTQRKLQMMANGELDIIMSASANSERERIAYFSIPYSQDKFYFVIKKTQKPLATIDDYLREKYFIILPRYGIYPTTITELRQRFSAQHLLTEFKDTEQGFALLNRNPRSVMLVLDSDYELLRDSYPDTELLPWHLSGDPIHLMFGRASTTVEDVELFNEWAKRRSIEQR